MNETRHDLPLAVEVTGVVSEPNSVDESSQLTCVVHRTFVITSQVFGHLLAVSHPSYSHSFQPCLL